jgi:dihydropteroate synthase
MSKDSTKIATPTLKCGNKDITLSHKVVMAILNITPDSFYDGGRNMTELSWLKKVEYALNEGAGIIDIGAISTRPGALDVNEKEELARLIPAIKSIIKNHPGCIISVDTYRSAVAEAVISEGALMINDISGGTYDPLIFEVVAKNDIPYIAMHILGTPQDMQVNPSYNDVTKEVLCFLEQQTTEAINAGVKQIIWDPGFGFGKTIEHNYTLMNNLAVFKVSGYPLLIGISRKSMIYRLLNTSPEEALNGTTVLNTIALLNGADILRVHDVKEAVEAVKIVSALKDNLSY